MPINTSALKTYSNVINGELTESSDGRTSDSVNPATGKVWAQIPRSTSDDAERAIQGANKAFHEWSGLSARERGDYLRKIGDSILPYASELLELEALNNGWVLDEYQYLAHVLQEIWYDAAGAAVHVGAQGKTVKTKDKNFSYTLRKPYGVVVGILPWNAPLFTFTIKAAYALAAGNTVVIKPSEQAAVGSLRYGEILKEVLPVGTVNVIAGKGSEIGDYLVSHELVRKVSLTGSKKTAEMITKATAHLPTSLVFELGGKSPNIVFEDADIDQAVQGVIQGIFTRNAGQICVAGSRILIQRSIFDEVIDKVKHILQGEGYVKFGDTLDTGNTMGPIANASQYEKVCGFIEEAKADGSKIIVGGRYGGETLLPEKDEYQKGYWVEPTLIQFETQTNRLTRDEIFGPVGVVIPFHTEEEAVQMANDTKFGLAAGVWTQNLGRAHRLVDQIEAGTVWVNTYGIIGVDVPFGGVKESGYGTDSILEYTQEKACIMNMN